MVETVYHIPGCPISLALLGDFHNGNATPIISSLQNHRPDMIALVGDLVYGRAPEDDMLLIDSQRNILPLLSACVSIAPTFMSFGNHEAILCPEDLELIKATGVKVLDNEWLAFHGMFIGGLTSHYVLDSRVYRAAHPSSDRYHRSNRFLDQGKYNKEAWTPIKQPDLAWLEARYLPHDAYTILLCHHPEYWPRLRDLPLNLVIAAHAHGGQWRVFNHGIYAPGQGFWPKYTSGVHKFNDSWLVISRGLTNTAKVPRLFNEPEIVYVKG